MNFDECLQIRVSLDSLAPALESFANAMILCAFIVSVGIVIAAAIRTMK